MTGPRFPLDDIPAQSRDMPPYAAFANGYKHGYEGVVTRGVCSLTEKTAQFQAWQDGYTLGEQDRDEVDSISLGTIFSPRR